MRQYSNKTAFGFPRSEKDPEMMVGIDMAFKSLIIFPKPLLMTAAHVPSERINNINKNKNRKADGKMCPNEVTYYLSTLTNQCICLRICVKYKKHHATYLYHFLNPFITMHAAGLNNEWLLVKLLCKTFMTKYKNATNWRQKSFYFSIKWIYF